MGGPGKTHTQVEHTGRAYICMSTDGFAQRHACENWVHGKAFATQLASRPAKNRVNGKPALDVQVYVGSGGGTLVIGWG